MVCQAKTLDAQKRMIVARSCVDKVNSLDAARLRKIISEKDASLT